MSIIGTIIALFVGIFCGRYFMVVKNHAQILNDMERIERILKTSDYKEFSVISPTQQKKEKELKEFENDNF
jgi:hypothetical protein